MFFYCSFLAITESSIQKLLHIFEKCKMIEILDKTPTEYKLKFLTNIEISNVLHCIEYKHFKEELDDIYKFKKQFSEEFLLSQCKVM